MCSKGLMELLVLVDALKRASVNSVTAVVPYFGYARQDRRPRSARVPITAKVAAKMFGAGGTDRLLTIDLHADQIQGFFDIPVDNVYSSPLLLADIWRTHGTENLIVVSPDVGGVVRARSIAKRLDDADLAIIDKRRPRANVATVMNIIGDVEGKTCVLVDDIVSSARTMIPAVASVRRVGLPAPLCIGVHALFAPGAYEELLASRPARVLTCDTVPHASNAISVVEPMARALEELMEGTAS